MQIIITGGGGFLGQLLAKELLHSDLEFDELLLVDIQMPNKISSDGRIHCLQMDLSDAASAQKIIHSNTKIVFHLAAVVSGHAEKDFDIGWKVNVDSTKYLLEACRAQNSNIRFVFASSCAVFGGDLPEMVLDQTALTPLGSYGIQKAICELMVNDYSRKGFIDGRALRLPTICIRPGKANLAASSFVSGIIREPINGEQAICPVSGDLAVWISSPETITKNFIYAATVASSAFGKWRSVNLPGIQVTVNEMVKTLEKLTNRETVERIVFQEDETIKKLVLTWPTKIDNARALGMGFAVDQNFDNFIIQYMQSLGMAN